MSLLYFNDMLIASNIKGEIKKVKAELNREFEMKVLYLSQEAYLKKVFERFGTSNSKRVMTPISKQFKLSISQSPKNIEELAYMESIPYANIVGSIMYAMVCTRPDIAHVMSLVSRFMSNPRKAHWH